MLEHAWKSCIPRRGTKRHRGIEREIAALAKEGEVPPERGDLARDRALGEPSCRERRNIPTKQQAIDAGMPESFNVLVKEIRSLGIDIELERN